MKCLKYLRVSSNFSCLQLPSDKFQKSHKKFRMFDKNSDHHIGTSFKQSFSPSFPQNICNRHFCLLTQLTDPAELAQGLASLGHQIDKDKLDKLFTK